MLHKVKKFNYAREILKQEVKVYCQDKRIPLSFRWDVFVESRLGDTLSYITDFDTLHEIFGGECSYYDDLFIDRYQTCDMIQEVENLEESVWHSEDSNSEKEWIAQCKEDGVVYVTVDQLNRLKEEILDKFILSFDHDW